MLFTKGQTSVAKSIFYLTVIITSVSSVISALDFIRQTIRNKAKRQLAFMITRRPIGSFDSLTSYNV